MIGNTVPDPGLYRGRTVHVRYTPFEHSFGYDVFQVLLDVDTIAQTAKSLKRFGYNTLNLLGFHDKDHGDRSGKLLRPWVEARFNEAGIGLDGGPIRLLCFPRVLNFVFNPISIFFGYRPNGQLAGVIYEVNNTFGDTHSYVCPASGALTEHQEAEKRLHVSPFFDVSGRYQFTMKPPGEGFWLAVDKIDAAGRNHLATLKAKRLPITDAALLAQFVAIPWMTIKVVVAIHWQALKLWIKGARYHDIPAPPPPMSVGQSTALLSTYTKPKSE